MFWLSKSAFRDIVREEVRQILKEDSEYRTKRVYDEQGRLVESEFTYSADLGHLVHIITKHHEGDFHIFAGHSRTERNHDQVRKAGGDVESEDRRVNQEQIFNRSHSAPSGYRLGENGLIIPDKDPC
jgi:hypothetical protein